MTMNHLMNLKQNTNKMLLYESFKLEKEKKKDIIAKLLTYSFKDISFDFDKLTDSEKKIFGDKETFLNLLQEYDLVKSEIGVDKFGL